MGIFPNGELNIDMLGLAQTAPRRPVRLPAAGLIVSAVGMLVISGCTEVPDYANPVEWYRGAVDVFDDDAPPPLPAEDVPGAHEPFPSVADVPELPSGEIQLSELEAVGEGLAADRENARYTDDVIRSGTESGGLQPPPEPEMQAEFQAPAAQLPAFEPVMATAGATGADIDVKALFASLFQSSGPSAVAPPPSETQIAMASGSGSSTALPSTSSLTALAGGDAGSFAGASFGSGKAAVIFFALGSAHLTKESRGVLRKVADIHKQRGGTVHVVGHASGRTREMTAAQHELVNFDVSFKRARAVADELIRQGVAPDRVVLTAKSDSQPVYGEWMPSGEAGNRRAEVFIDF